MQHLHDVPPPGPPHIGGLLRLPRHYASRKEQKETRKEHREKHEQINVQLILARKHDPVRHFFLGLSRIQRLQHQEEPRRLETVVLLGQRYDQSVPEILHGEDGVRLSYCDVSAQTHRLALQEGVPHSLGPVFPVAVLGVEVDGVRAGGHVGVRHVRIVMRAHVHVQVALSYVNHYPYVYVHEARLNYEKHHLSGVQRLRLYLALVWK